MYAMYKLNGVITSLKEEEQEEEEEEEEEGEEMNFIETHDMIHIRNYDKNYAYTIMRLYILYNTIDNIIIILVIGR